METLGMGRVSWGPRVTMGGGRVWQRLRSARRMVPSEVRERLVASCGTWWTATSQKGSDTDA